MARGYDATAGHGNVSEFNPVKPDWDVSTEPLTLVAKVYGTGVDSDGCVWFCMSNEGGTGHAAIAWDTSTYPGGRIQYQYWGGQGSPSSCEDEADFIQNRWYSVVARSRDENDHELDVYDLTADRHGNDTDGIIPTETSLASLRYVQGGVAGEANRGMDGYWAETAVYDVALTDAEVAAYQAGVSPLLIRPQSLLFYDPAISGERPDQIEGMVPSVTGSVTEIPHPPGILRPSSPMVGWMPGVSGTTYQRAIIEGLKAGG